MTHVDFEPVRERLQALSEGIGVKLPPSWEIIRPRPTFKSVGVVGAAGQTGELFTRSFADRLGSSVAISGVVRNRHLRNEGSLRVGFHTEIGSMFATDPEMVILATSNPTDEALREIAKHAQKPLTLVLPQNGVDVVPTAQKALAESGVTITLVRASLFTNVSRDQNGDLAYNKDKNRIALAPVGEDPDGNLRKAVVLFQTAGFDVKVESDYQAMEWGKLVGNLFGSTSSVTGLSPFKTFADRRLFGIEHQALKDRFEILDKAGIHLSDLWGIGRLRLLSKVPRWVGRDRGPVGKAFRGYVAKKLAAERNNQPSTAARQINEGATRVEATQYYHRPMTQLAEDQHLESPADWTILHILRRHANSRSDFSLKSQGPAERRKLLFEIYDLEKEDVFVNSNPVLRFVLKNLLKGLYHHYLKDSKVMGKENLAGADDTLKSGKSVLIASMHTSHADHQAGEEALEDKLSPEARKYKRYIVANRRFDKERLSGFFSRAMPHPVVWTITEGDSEDIRWRAEIFNRRSRKVIEQLLKEPCIMTAYVEGGRNKTPGFPLQPPALNSALWVLDSKIGLVVPTVILGTEKMLPAGAKWPAHADVVVEYCKPLDKGDLEHEREHVRKTRMPRREWDGYLVGEKILRPIAERLPVDRRGGY